MFRRNQNLLMMLMLNLLYPAVLGSIFYSVLGNIQAISLGQLEATCLLLMASVLLLFSVDFLYTAMHKRYYIVDFAIDIVILFTMFNAFDSVNFLVRAPDPSRYCLCLGITFAIFVVWDIPRKTAIGHVFGKLICFEISSAVVFLTAALLDFPLEVVGVLSLLAGSVLVALFRQIYRDRRGEFSQALVGAAQSATLSEKHLPLHDEQTEAQPD